MLSDRLPPIVISRTDYERLAALVDSRQRSALWRTLADELSRADIVEPEAVPATVVTMGSAVEYVDDSTGESRRVVLVYPGQEDISAGRVSVLTPVGTALIGLAVGHTAAWQTRSGEWKSLTVRRVTPPAPSAH